jgi:predicted phage terminase large subunit-like protein
VDTPWLDHLSTTEQLLETLIEGNGTRKRHSIPVTDPLKCMTKRFTIDPYVLGVWLGDGDTRRGYVTIGMEDTEVTLLLKECGEELSQLSDLHYRVEGLSERLRNTGIIGTYRNPKPKRIPQSYLRASVQQRLALLQGIVDSDGYVDDDVEVCWTSKGLVDDLLELLASLGIKAQAHESRATLNGKDCGPRWRVKWVSDLPCARLTRKRAAQKRTGFRGTHSRRYVVAVEPVASVPVKCVQVDSPSHLYLAGQGMIPTHNSDALLMSALQYVDVPGYSALILRRTWPDLNAPGAILDRARTWFNDTDAQSKDGGRMWEFPNGGRIHFGYMQYHRDKYKFQSAEYQFIGFDELTHFEENMYKYMFSRNRRPDVSCLNCRTNVRRYVYGDGTSRWKHTSAYGRMNCKKCIPDPAVVAQYTPSVKNGMTLFDVPLRMRSATNPGGIGHQWVKERFVDPRTKVDGAIFVPARLTDNPSLDQESYRESLQHLMPIDRERLLNGDWDVQEEGDFFARHLFNSVDSGPNTRDRVRYWDMAATQGGGDYTVGALLSHHEGRWCIEDIVRFQSSPPETERVIFQTAMADRVEHGHIQIVMEEEPGSAGKTAISHYQRNILPGFPFRGNRSTGDKTLRAKPLASAAHAGNVDMVAGSWNRDFLDEASLFPNGQHDDQIDACGGAMEALAFGRRSRLLA